MSFTTGTTHYGLPQYTNAQMDIPSWADDITNAFEKLDTTLYEVAEQGNASSGKVDNLETQVQANTTTTTKNTQDIVDLTANYQEADNTLSNRIAANTREIATNKTNISNNTANINGINSRLGDTDISDLGDGTVTGAIKNISGLEGETFIIQHLANKETFSVPGLTRQNCSLPLNTPEGYYPIAIHGFTGGVTTVVVDAVVLRPELSDATVILYNSAEEIMGYTPGTVTVDVLYCKKTLINL